MLRVLIVIGFISLFAATACLQDHEPVFFSQEIENLITGLDTAAWQLDMLVQNGTTIIRNECEQATLIYFYKSNNAFENIDIASFCNGNGGVIESGTWEVKVNKALTDRQLTLNFGEEISLTYQIENITPFFFRLLRNTGTGETSIMEIREYVRVEIETDGE